MPDFTSLCLKWFKGFFHKGVLYFLLGVLVFSLYSVHRGAAAQKRVSADSKEFQKREASIFSNIMSYDEYSNTGIAVLFLPGASSLFFSNPPIMSQLSATFNSIAKLDIDEGGFRIGGNSQFHFRLSQVVQVLLSILALYTVFVPMRSREYLKFLSSGCSRKTVLLSIITSGFVFIALSFLFILGCGLGVVLLHGIPLHQLDFTGLCRYAAVTLLMILSFIVAGALCGTILKKAAAYTLLPLVWFTFVFLVPNIIDSTYEEKSTAVPSTNKLYNDKLKIINDFEKWVLENEGKFDRKRIEKFRELVEYYWKEIFPKVEALDRCRRDKIAELVKGYNFFSMFTITTFYNRTADEIGGRGYEGYLAFYDNVLKLRRAFVRYWIDRVYYHNPKELVSFVRENENLFPGDSRVPDYFVMGFLFNLCIVLALVPVLSWRFNKYLDALEDKAPFKKDNAAVVLKKGEAKVLKLFRRAGIVEGFYNLLSGRASSNRTSNPLRLKVDNVDVSVSGRKANFLYVCHPDRIPGYLRVKDFISFVRRLLGLSGEQEQAIYAALGPDLIRGKRFGQLDREQRGEVLLAVLPYFRHRIYLVGNMGTDTGMSSSFIFKLSEIMKQWCDSGSSVLYLTTEREVKVESPGNQKDRDFLEIEMWLEMVNHLKGLSEEK